MPRRIESTDVAAPGRNVHALEARLRALGPEPSTERVDVLNELAWEIGFSDVQRTEELAREAIAQARALAYERGIAWGELNSAFHDYFTGNYEAAIEKGGGALRTFREIGDELGLGNALTGSGLVYWSLGDFERAISDLHRAVEILRRLDRPEEEAWALTSLGGVYENLGDFGNALDCQRRALDLFRRLSLPIGESRALTGLGTIYQRQGDLERALQNHFDALALAEQMENPIGMSRALNDIGTLYHSQGHLERSEDFLARALRIRTELGNVPAKITSLLDLGRVQMEKGDVARSLELLSEALVLARQTKTKPKIYRAHEALSQAYEKSGDARKALEHHREFQRLKEEVLGEETATRLRNLQIQLESETVAQLREAQAKLIQSERMATLGKLAAGIAHEVNTPVGVIQASADVAARLVSKLAEEAGPRANEPRFRASLEALETHRATVAEAGRRLSEIVSNLKRLTNLDRADVQLMDLNETIESIVTLVEPRFGARVRIVKNLGSIPPLQARPADINQALLTLLLNAGESIDGEGTVSITTRSEDGRIHVSTADTGRGMPEEQLSEVFDVGLSRRGPSVRLHVGLAHVKSTVESHGGEIEVESEPGRGTTFKIALPARGV